MVTPRVSHGPSGLFLQAMSLLMFALLLNVWGWEDISAVLRASTYCCVQPTHNPPGQKAQPPGPLSAVRMSAVCSAHVRCL